MKRLSTPCMNAINRKTRQHPERNECSPRRETMDFLKQFARVYQAEPVLKPELCGYILN